MVKNNSKYCVQSDLPFSRILSSQSCSRRVSRSFYGRKFLFCHLFQFLLFSLSSNTLLNLKRFLKGAGFVFWKVQVLALPRKITLVFQMQECIQRQSFKMRRGWVNIWSIDHKILFTKREKSRWTLRLNRGCKQSKNGF